MEKTKEQLAKEAEDKKSAEVNKAEGKEEDKEDFKKEDEKVDANKYNQALRKSREAEAEKRELEEEKKRLTEKILNQKDDKPSVKKKEEKKEEEEDDDFWGDDKDDEKEEETKEEPKINSQQVKEIIDAKIRPFIESESQRNKLEKKKARQEFYEVHPEYLTDADKWADLLDELSGSIVPSGDYYQDLEKAHRIIGGETVVEQKIEQQQAENATDAGTSGGIATPNKTKSDNISAMDKKIMEGTGVSADTIKEMRRLEKEGDLKLEF